MCLRTERLERILLKTKGILKDLKNRNTLMIAGCKEMKVTEEGTTEMGDENKR